MGLIIILWTSSWSSKLLSSADTFIPSLILCDARTLRFLIKKFRCWRTKMPINDDQRPLSQFIYKVKLIQDLMTNVPLNIIICNPFPSYNCCLSYKLCRCHSDTVCLPLMVLPLGERRRKWRKIIEEKLCDQKKQK